MQANCFENECTDGVRLARSWVPLAMDRRYRLPNPLPSFQRFLRGRPPIGRGIRHLFNQRAKKVEVGELLQEPSIRELKCTGRYSYHLEFLLQHVSDDEHIELKRIISPFPLILLRRRRRRIRRVLVSPLP